MARRRPLLIGAAVLLALPLVPLPRACDPRREELPEGTYAALRAFDQTLTRAELEAAWQVVDPHRALAPYLRLDDAALEVRLAPGDREPAVRVVLRSVTSKPPA